MAFASVLEYIGEYIDIKWQTIQVAHIFMDIDKTLQYLHWTLIRVKPPCKCPNIQVTKVCFRPQKQTTQKIQISEYSEQTIQKTKQI